jgi:hypothetical protein
MPGLRRFAAQAQIRRPTGEFWETDCLGLTDEEGLAAPGTLMAAALGAEPDRPCTDFHVTVMSLEDDRVLALPSLADAASLLHGVEALGGPTSRFWTGPSVDHALRVAHLWHTETHPPRALEGRPWRDLQPEGDGETWLRRWIDDAVNWLEAKPENRRRRDDGLPPANVLWPWGGGEPPELPNLALRWGAPLRVATDSWRVQGLARLGGLRSRVVEADEMGLNDAEIVALKVLPRLPDAEERVWRAERLDALLFDEPFSLKAPVAVALGRAVTLLGPSLTPDRASTWEVDLPQRPSFSVASGILNA